MILPSLKFLDLIEHWKALRDGADVPLRSQFDPAAKQVRHLLGNLLILERTADGYRTRLWGTTLRELFNRELQDQRFLDLIPHETRIERATWYDQVLDRREMAIIRSRLIRGDREHLVVELYLPMVADQSTATQILGAILPIEPVRWFSGGSEELLEWNTLKVTHVPVRDLAGVVCDDSLAEG